MTGSDVLHILLGAALVAIGVLAAALGERIRGVRATARETSPRERSIRERSEKTVHAERTVIPVVAAPVPASKPPRVPRGESKVVASTDGSDDVIAALVAAGFKKQVASEATWACGATDRATVESWTAAALRQCARGGMS